MAAVGIGASRSLQIPVGWALCKSSPASIASGASLVVDLSVDERADLRSDARSDPKTTESSSRSLRNVHLVGI